MYKANHTSCPLCHCVYRMFNKRLQPTVSAVYTSTIMSTIKIDWNTIVLNVFGVARAVLFIGQQFLRKFNMRLFFIVITSPQIYTHTLTRVAHGDNVLWLRRFERYYKFN